MAHLINAERRKFLDQPPPPGYIAGLGRGAVGFTTRSDIGGARNIEPGAGSVPGFGDKRKFGDDGGNGGGDDDDDDVGGRNYDEFEGDSRDGFSDPRAIYDHEDKEADDIWESVDRLMDSRRKERREKMEKEDLENLRTLNPKLQQQLVDLKQQLSQVSNDEWLNLPEAGDISRNNQRKQRETYVPVPDSVIERAKQENETVSIIQPTNPNIYGDLTSGTTTTDLTQVGMARKTVLDLKLNQVGDSISGKTCVDPKGYLTDLKSQRIASTTEISDIKKARLLFRSVTQTNPKHAPGWIASAKLEMYAGKLSVARKIIAQGCLECPDDEEVWIENANLQTPDNAKLLLAQAVKVIPHSIKIWLYAAALEKDVKMKKRVLRRALEFVPNSVKLWKEAVELEEPEDAKILLGRAVECVGDNVDLWLALANLESYDRAREVLNKARTAIPTSIEIWIAAAQLEEAVNHTENVARVIKKAIRSLSSAHAGQSGGASRVTDRERWIAEAEKCEKNGALATCQAIIFEAIAVERVRAIYTSATTHCPTASPAPWIEAHRFEVRTNNINRARATLEKASLRMPKREEILLEFVRFETRLGNKKAAATMLAIGLQDCPTSGMLWAESIAMEPRHAQKNRCVDALNKCNNDPYVLTEVARIFWMDGKHDKARTWFTRAIATFPDHGDAWAYYYAFLLRTVRTQAAIEQETKQLQIKCLEADPHHGLLWQSVSKLPGHSKLKSDQILKLVALQISQQQQQQKKQVNNQ
ncbi:TPR repeat-containing protein [Cavenderia fasciculata]|uniref:TPR repeat-containing protein n=1 Tax=Cavenderia fasciculata TaxID=261658 RepID=F4QDF3_CACFS|nr:TPR repeat-containing protein [Cavenderia fasciculata]EGG14571.1 TPR repeat-containing protein [Cavenderia fasciculata]|eukprot:XP_004366091.1 TPR repeat-containing protein [Cavenderia fasciculata]